ncbi:PREDICTED: formin-like protein 18 [Haliaeetus leucocephalus]|uniref:formin-like protein 18 n=1 Tax=Haliaeetus leucocephalus TaxID=52644 RepID=UPI00053CBA45|nr:PREDICTED: formin-like protein 18 [Haliaeetus leucocephalus]
METELQSRQNSFIVSETIGAGSLCRRVPQERHPTPRPYTQPVNPAPARAGPPVPSGPAPPGLPAPGPPPPPATPLPGTAAGLWLGRAKLTGNGGPALLPHGHPCLPVTPELRGTGPGHSRFFSGLHTAGRALRRSRPHKRPGPGPGPGPRGKAAAAPGQAAPPIGARRCRSDKSRPARPHALVPFAGWGGGRWVKRAGGFTSGGGRRRRRRRQWSGAPEADRGGSWEL